MNRITIFSLIVLCACTGKQEQTTKNNTADTTHTELKYAQGFRVTHLNNYKVVEIITPFQGATSGYTYLLVPKNEEIPEHAPNVKVIRTPIASIVCTSTTHIPLLDYLGETEKLVGFPTTDYISSEKMRNRIDAGKVEDLGVDKGINLERLAVLKPELVMGYTMNSDYGQFKKIEELGMPAVLNSEYLEKHPLGRAEWIKYMALFFDKEKEADSIFTIIEKEYNETKALAATSKSRPSVLCGIVYGDAWFLPGGQNYASRLLHDAGCRYLWESDSTNGYLELSFESVYDKARNADRWIGVGSFSSLKEIQAADHRYEKFKAYKDGEVYTYNARKGAKGGSEFLELGYLRPDLILKDLVAISNPDLMPGYSLFFHEKLK